MQMFLFESQRDSIPQPRVGPSRTGDPPSSDFGGTSELPWVIRLRLRSRLRSALARQVGGDKPAKKSSTLKGLHRRRRPPLQPPSG